MRLPEKLSLLRKEKGLTQSELAERMDVSRQAVSRWEAGESAPSTENLRRLCELYDVPLDELFNGSRREPEKKTVSQTGENQSGKKQNRKMMLIPTAAMLIFLAAALIYISVSAKNVKKAVPMREMEREEVELKPDNGFDFEW